MNPTLPDRQQASPATNRRRIVIIAVCEAGTDD